MFNDKIKGLLVGLLAGSVLTGGLVFARSGNQWIDASYDNIKLYVNGSKVDTSSNEPFIYNGSTYLPVRAVAEALGQNVDWDGNTKSVYIGSKPSGAAYLMDVCPPYSGNADEQTFKMAGKLYSKGFITTNNANILVNLESRYSELKCVIGHPDNVLDCRDSTVTFYVDGNVVKEVELKKDELPKTISIPLNYGKQLNIKTSFTGPDGSGIGISNITVE